MIEGLPADLLDNIGVVALVVLFVLGLATGRLFIRRQYDDVADDRQAWRTEARIKDQQIGELTEQNNILLRDIAPAMTSFMAALERAGKEKP